MELKNVGLILFYSYVHLFVDARWSGNLKPNFIRDYETTLNTADRYIKHSDLSQHFRLLEEDGEYLLIGARNAVYNFSLKSFKPSYKLDWISAEHTKETCIMKGKSEEVCQNFIRVLLKKSPSEFLICGTNAYSPKCRVYETSLSGELRLQEGSEAQGVGFCPYDPDHNSTSIYADGEFYGATVSDFNAEDALVYSKGIRTLANDRKVFNNPSFISAMDYENFVYFTFRETAVDFASCGDKVLSRIGRVCKNDEGGSRHILRNSFTSFTKATINCSLPGADPYYFNEVQAMTRLVKKPVWN